MFINTDKTEWLPPIHSMLTSYGSLNLLDLSRPEHVPFLVCDWVPDPVPPDTDAPKLGELSVWPNTLTEDWSHALSADMIHLFNDYYFETYTDAFGEPSVELHHSRCDALIYTVAAPEVAAVSVWLTNIWEHHRVCTA